MKKITLFISALWLTALTSLYAQPTPATGGAAASVNPPGIWTGPTASTSSKTIYQGNAAQTWNNAPLPVAPNQASSTFLSLYSKNNIISGAFATLTGLTPGFTYELKYDMMSASAKVGATFTDWAYTGEIGIFNSTVQGWNNNAIVSNQHQFTVANQSKWISDVFTFKATNTTAILGFRALGQTAKGSIVNLNINPGALNFKCEANTQVQLSKTFLYNKCFQPLVNLNDAFTGVVPQGYSLIWLKTNTHSMWSVLQNNIVTEPGEYYAFFYSGNCFNTALSTAKVTVAIHAPLPGDGQVHLTKSSILNECPNTGTVDLTTAFTEPPTKGVEVVWFTNPTHSGLPVADPKHASILVSKYYAFFKDIANNCYNTNNSIAIVKVTQRECPPTAIAQFQRSLGEANPEVKSEIAIYPNPVSDELTIQADNFDHISDIQIYDTKGLIVYKSNGNPERSIDVKHLTSGVYVVKMKEKSGKVSSYKIMVAK